MFYILKFNLIWQSYVLLSFKLLFIFLYTFHFTSVLFEQFYLNLNLFQSVSKATFPKSSKFEFFILVFYFVYLINAGYEGGDRCRTPHGL